MPGEYPPRASDSPPLSYQVPQPQPFLSGGMKFGYGALGFLMGLVGILLAWLINAGKHPTISQSALISSVVGFGIGVVAWVALYVFLFTVGLMAAATY